MLKLGSYWPGKTLFSNLKTLSNCQTPRVKPTTSHPAVKHSDWETQDLRVIERAPKRSKHVETAPEFTNSGSQNKFNSKMALFPFSAKTKLYKTTVSVKMVGTLWGLLVPSMLVYKIWWPNRDKQLWEGRGEHEKGKNSVWLKCPNYFCLRL